MSRAKSPILLGSMPIKSKSPATKVLCWFPLRNSTKKRRNFPTNPSKFLFCLRQKYTKRLNFIQELINYNFLPCILIKNFVYCLL